MTSNILVITDNAEDAQTLRDALCKANDGPFKLEWKRTLSDSIELIAEGGVDAILVDLALPDSEGIETFDRLFAAAPQTPIMTLCAEDDEPLAVEMVEYGSQGYLSRGHFKNYLVPQGLRNMIQRKAVEVTLLEEKARAEIVLNSISDAVITTDISGTVDYLNVAAENITGWSAAQAVGQPIANIFKIISSETRLPVRNTVELVLQRDHVVGLPKNTLLVRQAHSRFGREACGRRDRVS
jgi:DNA-binding NarL/FixJ family response regulator